MPCASAPFSSFLVFVAPRSQHEVTPNHWIPFPFSPTHITSRVAAMSTSRDLHDLSAGVIRCDCDYVAPIRHIESHRSSFLARTSFLTNASNTWRDISPTPALASRSFKSNQLDAMNSLGRGPGDLERSNPLQLAPPLVVSNCDGARGWCFNRFPRLV